MSAAAIHERDEMPLFPILQEPIGCRIFHINFRATQPAAYPDKNEMKSSNICIYGIIFLISINILLENYFVLSTFGL